jgi:hypothetical protein
MKRKVGDKVIIKSLDWWKAQPKNEYGNIMNDMGFVLMGIIILFLNFFYFVLFSDLKIFFQ